MELKQLQNSFKNVTKFLLIVPYGIETITQHVRNPEHALLLIVPYGIETIS